jgi:hypothetical protein
VHENLAARRHPAQLRAFEDRLHDDTDMAETLQALLPLYFHRRIPPLMATLGQGLQSARGLHRGAGRCMADYDVRRDLAASTCRRWCWPAGTPSSCRRT